MHMYCTIENSTETQKQVINSYSHCNTRTLILLHGSPGYLLLLVSSLSQTFPRLLSLPLDGNEVLQWPLFSIPLAAFDTVGSPLQIFLLLLLLHYVFLFFISIILDNTFQTLLIFFSLQSLNVGKPKISVFWLLLFPIYNHPVYNIIRSHSFICHLYVDELQICISIPPRLLL